LERGKKRKAFSKAGTCLSGVHPTPTVIHLEPYTSPAASIVQKWYLSLSLP
jgi:hypothetical protein